MPLSVDNTEQSTFLLNKFKIGGRNHVLCPAQNRARDLKKKFTS